jgi:VanZ family protein
MPTDESRARWRLMWAFAAYAGFIVYQTITTDSGWSCRSFDWHVYALTHRPSRGDVLANWVAYIPLGVLAMMAAGASRRAWAIALVWLGCTLISLGLETVQVCLPDRIPSVLDVITNSLGALTGIGAALFVVRWARRIEQPRDGGWTPPWFMSSPLPLIAILAFGLWLAVQTSPWRFGLTVSVVRANLAFLSYSPDMDFNWWKFVIHAGSWIGLGGATLLALKPYAPRLTLLMAAQLMVLGGQTISAGASLSYEEVGAVLLSWMVVLPMAITRRMAWVATITLLAGWCCLAAYQLQPQLGNPGRWSWWPQVGRSNLLSSLNYALVFCFFALLPCMVAAWGRKLRGWSLTQGAGIGVLTLLLTIALEIAQLSIPGRWGDTSGPLLMMLTWLVVWSLGPFAKAQSPGSTL